MKKCVFPYVFRIICLFPGLNYTNIAHWVFSDVERLTAELQDYENFVNDLSTSAENHTADWIKGLIEKVSFFIP